MRLFRSSFFLFICSIVVSGCASNDQSVIALGYFPEAIEGDQSRLVIYIEPVQEVEGRSPYLYLDNEPKGKIFSNHYRVIPVSAGAHLVVIKQIDSLTNLYGEDSWPVRPKSVIVKLNPGEEKYLRYTVRINKSVFNWYDAFFEEVSKEKALIDLDFMAHQP
jgi:hypothetical protein